MPSPYPEPYLIEFPSIGGSQIGYITVGQFDEHLPFEVKRAFWTHHTPTDVTRGQHAHHTTEELLIAVAGQVTVTCETALHGTQTHLLDRPKMGLYRPPHAWVTMRYSADAVLLVLASTDFDESDYIRDYADFKRVWGDHTPTNS